MLWLIGMKVSDLFRILQRSTSVIFKQTQLVSHTGAITSHQRHTCWLYHRILYFTFDFSVSCCNSRLRYESDYNSASTFTISFDTSTEEVGKNPDKNSVSVAYYKDKLQSDSAEDYNFFSHRKPYNWWDSSGRQKGDQWRVRRVIFILIMDKHIHRQA